MKMIVISSKSLLSQTLVMILTCIFCTSALAGDQKRPQISKHDFEENDIFKGNEKFKDNRENLSASYQKRPQIPKHDFEWTGTFRGNEPFNGNDEDLFAPQVVGKLTVRGKWQTSENGRFFNLYMAMGDEDDDTWVENLIYEDKLYSITHKWHTELPPILPDGSSILGKCFQNQVFNTENPLEPLPITVDGFNRGLARARLVGREKIGGKPMNHFRHTCLTRAAPQFGFPSDPGDTNNKLAIPFKVFSDIYVPAGRSYPWTKWLQFGDGVGPDPQQDEWFLINKSNRYPDDIILPEQCELENIWPIFGDKTLIFTQYTTCTNLVSSKEPED